jgi:hypothetical protein
MSRRGEGVAAAWRLTGPAAASHKASKAVAHITGFSGIRELLAAQIGHPQVLTAFQRWGSGRRQKEVTGKQLLALSLAWQEARASKTQPLRGKGTSPGQGQRSLEGVRFGLAKGQTFCPTACKKISLSIYGGGGEEFP